MCGRYATDFNLDATEYLNTLFSYDTSLLLDNLPNYNVLPNSNIPILSRQQLSYSKWGFMPEWATTKSNNKPMINARGESMRTKPYFRDAFKSSRVIVPMNGYYEWKDSKTKYAVPYYIQSENSKVLTVAALHTEYIDAHGKPIQSVAIVTKNAEPSISHIHQRMPLCLNDEFLSLWLKPNSELSQLESLVTKPIETRFKAYSVSDKINSLKYHDSSLIESVQRTLF